MTWISYEFDRAHEPHDDQVLIWADQSVEALLDWLREFNDYDDKVQFFDALQGEIRSIALAAHMAGFQRGVESLKAVHFDEARSS